MKNKFLSQGFIKFENLISQEDVSDLKVSYDALISYIKRTTHLPSDLGGQSQDFGGV